MRDGSPPELESLIDWEFRGWNVGSLPHLVGIRKFKKGFYLEDPIANAEQNAWGYNVLTVQNPHPEPWLDHRKNGESIRLGYFRLHAPGFGRTHPDYPNAACIDYWAAPRNPRWDPSRLLLDYIVRPYDQDPDLYLGKAYLTLPGGAPWLPLAYFVLARANPGTLFPHC